MSKAFSRKIHSVRGLVKSELIKSAIAAVIYAAFAVYLYQPYFKTFSKAEYIFVLNAVFASLGCYVLSRRWVGSFAGSFFAGAIYGFGPFLLWLGKFHPAGGFMAASIPWLFCPAAFGPKGKWRWVRVPLAIVPFLAIALFFQVSAHFRLFAIPIQLKLGFNDLATLTAPVFAVSRGLPGFGFYHIPVAPLIAGFSMLLVGRRAGVIVILCIGAALAFCGPFLKVSPIIWLAIPMLCCCVTAGAGIQGLATAGFADRVWVLITTLILAALAILTLTLAAKCFQIFAGLGAGHAKVLVEAARMYILGTVVVAIIFIMARARLRGHQLRQVLLCSAMALDVFIGARFTVDAVL